MAAPKDRTYNLLLFLITVLYFLLLFLSCLGCIYLDLYYALVPFMTVVDIGWVIACIALLVKRDEKFSLWPKWWKKKRKYTTHDFEKSYYAHRTLAYLVFGLGFYFYYLHPTLELIIFPASTAIICLIEGRNIGVQGQYSDAYYRACNRGTTYLEEE